jgi:hypothetical protein
MSEHSMTEMTTASTSVPNGSPTRCATTSAWCTAARTAPIKATPESAESQPLSGRNHAVMSKATAARGAIQSKRVMGA